MNAFQRLSRNLKTLNLPSLLTETLDDYQEDIVTAIQEQLAEGKRGDGTNLPPYKESTKLLKRERGTIFMGDRIALIDTGDFWRSMFATAYDSMIEVDAKDWKRDMLVERYGEAIFQISHTQWEAIYEKAETDYKQRVTKWLNQ